MVINNQRNNIPYGNEDQIAENAANKPIIKTTKTHQSTHQSGRLCQPLKKAVELQTMKKIYSRKPKAI